MYYGLFQTCTTIFLLWNTNADILKSISVELKGISGNFLVSRPAFDLCGMHLCVHVCRTEQYVGVPDRRTGK